MADVTLQRNNVHGIFALDRLASRPMKCMYTEASFAIRANRSPVFTGSAPKQRIGTTDQLIEF